ncbi:hypothetical protein, partial [Mesorhizobium sp. M7A.F.Ca.CA.001.05.1.1]|uniref:hypothetical protein n=1 Tax=Mesorhizobium sp. M7A.F.Ca.CA.001.05.1.1 TaxID=2496721 RepID=UPI0019D19D72
ALSARPLVAALMDSRIGFMVRLLWFSRRKRADAVRKGTSMTIAHTVSGRSAQRRDGKADQYPLLPLYIGHFRAGRQTTLCA